MGESLSMADNSCLVDILVQNNYYFPIIHRIIPEKSSRPTLMPAIGYRTVVINSHPLCNPGTHTKPTTEFLQGILRVGLPVAALPNMAGL